MESCLRAVCANFRMFVIYMVSLSAFVTMSGFEPEFVIAIPFIVT